MFGMEDQHPVLDTEEDGLDNFTDQFQLLFVDKMLLHEADDVAEEPGDGRLQHPHMVGLVPLKGFEQSLVAGQLDDQIHVLEAKKINAVRGGGRSLWRGPVCMPTASGLRSATATIRALKPRKRIESSISRKASQRLPPPMTAIFMTLSGHHRRTTGDR